MLEPFTLAAVMVREDPRDAVVSHKYASLEEMPAGSVVGTSSLRRELMVRSRFPHLKVEMIRGNVGTRLSKLDNGQYDTLVMAAAGLKRLGLSDRIRSIIPPEVSLPAPGQGAIGIEAVENDEMTQKYVEALNDEDTRLCSQAERAVSRALGGSCQVPLAAYATIDDGQMFLRALVGNHMTGEFVTAEYTGPANEPEENARKVLDQLIEKGAKRLLKEVARKVMRTILNMKPGPGGRRLQKEMEAKTSGSVYWPAFTFDRSEDYEESVKEILEGAERGALLILVSPTTVSFMKDIFPQLPESVRFACVGEPTAKALTAAFPAARKIFFPHGSSLESGSELLFELLLEEGLPSEVVLIRGDTGRQFLIDALRDKDVPVTVAPIYKRIPLKVSDDQKRWIGRGEAPVIYLTSTDAIRILEENVGDEGREWLQSASVLTIHPRIQEHLIEEGFKNVELVESHCSGLADKLLSLAEQVSND